MAENAPVRVLNNLLHEAAGSPVEISRQLTAHWLQLSGEDRDTFVLAMIGHIASTEAMRRRLRMEAAE